MNDIINNHIQITNEIIYKIKPLMEFKKYIKYGYYPYYKENKELYFQKLLNTINLIIEYDLPSIQSIEHKHMNSLKKLLQVIAESVPFKANTSKLSDRIGITRNTLLLYLTYLQKAQTISFLNTADKGYGYLTKPEKIYLDNTNLAYAFSNENANIGNIRETFFLNQVSKSHKVNYSKVSDFLVDEKYTFEIGGKNKTSKQIKSLENAFIAQDDIEIGYKNIIPLWLFGFLY